MTGEERGERRETEVGKGDHQVDDRGSRSVTDYVVAIASYRRPDGLARLLASLAEAGATNVLVVDNDPLGSARTACETSSLRPEYVLEPRPGIAAARNRALRVCGPDRDAIIFVDDDERVDPTWFQELVQAAQDPAVAVVSGPVLPEFTASPPRWVTRGDHFRRTRRRTGVVEDDYLPATNNTLVKLSALSTLADPWFDESFGLTGGSDSEFFSRLSHAGIRFHWCDEAVVHETVDVERLSRRWVVRRAYRQGNVTGRLHLRESGRLAVLGRGALKMAAGVAAWLRDVGRGRPFPRQATWLAFSGCGEIGAVLGIFHVEYERRQHPHR